MEEKLKITIVLRSTLRSYQFPTCRCQWPTEKVRRLGFRQRKCRWCHRSRNTDQEKVGKVLYVPDLNSGLLSISKITDSDYSVQFKRDSVELIDLASTVIVLGDEVKTCTS